jgi:hypothetical protein
MRRAPFRLLLSGYGLAALAGAAVAAGGAGWIAALLVLWLGGAVVTLGLAARTAARMEAPEARDVEARDPEAEEAALAVALAAWEADRLADRAALRPADRRRATGFDG